MNNIINISKKLNFFVFFFYTIITCFWTGVLILRYYSLDYHTYDDAFFGNIISQVANYYKYYTTIEEMNALGDHFTVNLILFFPLFKIYPTHLWLQFFKLLAYLSCPFILYKIGKNLNLKGVYLYITPLIFLCNFFLIQANFSRFQPSSLSLPFILLSFLYAIKKDYFKMFLFLIFLIGFKENLPLVWVCMGFFLILYQKKYKLGIITILLGVIIGLFLFKVVIAYFNKGGASLHNDNFNPFAFLNEKILFIFLFIAACGFIHFFYWKVLVFCFPSLSISLLGDEKFYFFFHYLDIPSTVFLFGFTICLTHIKKNEIFSIFNKKYIKYCIYIFFILLSCIVSKQNIDYLNFNIKNLLKYKSQNENLITEIKFLKNNLKNKQLPIWTIEKIAPFFIEYNLKSIDVHNKALRVNGLNRLLKNNKEKIIIITNNYETSWLTKDSYIILKNHIKLNTEKGIYKRIYKNLKEIEVYRRNVKIQ